MVPWILRNKFVNTLYYSLLANELNSIDPMSRISLNWNIIFSWTLNINMVMMEQEIFISLYTQLVRDLMSQYWSSLDFFFFFFFFFGGGGRFANYCICL